GDFTSAQDSSRSALCGATRNNILASRALGDKEGHPQGVPLRGQPGAVSVPNKSWPAGLPTGNNNGIAYSDRSSRIVILSVAKNQLVGVSVGATDYATPSQY